MPSDPLWPTWVWEPHGPPTPHPWTRALKLPPGRPGFAARPWLAPGRRWPGFARPRRGQEREHVHVQQGPAAGARAGDRPGPDRQAAGGPGPAARTMGAAAASPQILATQKNCNGRLFDVFGLRRPSPGPGPSENGSGRKICPREVVETSGGPRCERNATSGESVCPWQKFLLEWASDPTHEEEEGE